MQPRKLTIGTDVEVGLYHRPSAQYIPATKMNCPAEKGAALPIRINGKWLGTYHRDNILVEYQSKPCRSAKTLYDNVKAISTALNRHYTNLIDARLVTTPVVRYGNPAMLALDEAQEMGCDRDFDAYTGEKQEAADPADMGPYRVCSGHWHIGGIEDLTDEQKWLVCQWLDLTLTLPTLVNEGLSQQYALMRRWWYGQAGRFRYKPYGIEYRTPSNYWTTWGLNSMTKAFQTTTEAVMLAEAGIKPADLGDVQAVRAVIDFKVTPDNKSLYMVDPIEMRRTTDTWRRKVNHHTDIWSRLSKDQLAKIAGVPLDV